MQRALRCPCARISRAGLRGPADASRIAAAPRADRRMTAPAIPGRVRRRLASTPTRSIHARALVLGGNAAAPAHAVHRGGGGNAAVQIDSADANDHNRTACNGGCRIHVCDEVRPAATFAHGWENARKRGVGADPRARVSRSGAQRGANRSGHAGPAAPSEVFERLASGGTGSDARDRTPCLTGGRPFAACGEAPFGGRRAPVGGQYGGARVSVSCVGWWAIEHDRRCVVGTARRLFRGGTGRLSLSCTGNVGYSGGDPRTPGWM